MEKKVALLFLALCCTLVGFAQFLSPTQKLTLENHPSKDGYFIAKFFDKETNVLQEQWVMFSSVPEVNEQNYNSLVKTKRIKADGDRFSFYSSGKILLKWPYKNGDRTGLLQVFYESGELMYKVNSNKYLEGKLTHYFKNGKISKTEIFEAGILSDSTKEYYPNGKLKNKKQYRDGELHGNYASYYKNGKPRRKRDYKNGEFSTEKCFNTKGQEIACLPLHTEPTIIGGFETLKLAIEKIDINPPTNRNNTTLFRIILNLDSLGNATFKNYYYKSNLSLTNELKSWVKNLPKFTPYLFDGVPEKCEINIAFALCNNEITWAENILTTRKTNRNQSLQQAKTMFLWDFASHVPQHQVFFVADKMPQFPGGNSAFQDFISSQMKYPTQAKKENIAGKVIVSFIVNKQGVAKSYRFLKSVHPLLDEEVFRFLKLMPNWIPAENNGTVSAKQTCSFISDGKSKIEVMPSKKPQIHY